MNELKLLIPERAILISTEPGDLVLDPFGGGGSTFHACEKHHRHWIGSELYDCRHVQQRLEETFPLFLRHRPRFDPQALFQPNEAHHHQVLRRRQG